MRGLPQIRNRGGFIEAALAIIVVIALLGGGLFLYLKHSNAAQTLNNGGYSYSFAFPNSAKVTASGQEYFKSSDGSVVVSAKPSSATSDCGQNGGHVAQKVAIEGGEHDVCVDNNTSAYTANFQDGGKWHNVTIFSSDLSKELDQASAIQIIESVKVQ